MLNFVGLVFNILGVVIAFFFARPQPSHDEGISTGLELGTFLPEVKMTVAQFNVVVEKRRKRYLLLSNIGLMLMGLGFVLQAIAAWPAAAAH